MESLGRGWEVELTGLPWTPLGVMESCSKIRVEISSNAVMG